MSLSVVFLRPAMRFARIDQASLRFSTDGFNVTTIRLLISPIKVENRLVTAPRAEELWVAGCLQATLSGVVIGHHDRNRGPQYDFDLCHASGVTFGAVEVTAAADSAYVESWIIIDGNSPWQDHRLTGGWKVYVRPTRKPATSSPSTRSFHSLCRRLNRQVVPAFLGTRVPATHSNTHCERWESRGPTKRLLTSREAST